jgi:aminodeoxyfutalosine deaminase
MKKYLADYLFPNTGPGIKNALLITENDGKILDVLIPSHAEYNLDNTEILKGVLCPGFVNTHCHFELSYLKNRISSGLGLDSFISAVESQKLSSSPEDIREAMMNAENEMISEGIIAVGDIMNTPDSLLFKSQSKLTWFSFIETYGSSPEIADHRFDEAYSLFLLAHEKCPGFKASIVPHATYSCSPDLFRKIGGFASVTNLPLCIHHQESNDENLFFFDKTGAIPDRLNRFGIDISAFQPTRQRPLKSISAFMPVENSLMLVHNTFATQEDIDFAISAYRDIWWCFCPKANLFIEKQLPDIPRFMAYSRKITLGTDSLAANNSLSILEEMKTISQYYPEINLEELLRWACLNGAAFLGIGNWAGSFEKGKNPGINLIENIDPEDLKLTSKSKIRNLTSYQA